MNVSLWELYSWIGVGIKWQQLNIFENEWESVILDRTVQQPTSSFDLSYLPYASSVLRDFDFGNVQYQSNNAHSEFALAALNHELQQCQTDTEQVQHLKSLQHVR